MNLRRYNIGVGVLAALFTLILLLGGQILWQKYIADKSVNRLFQDVAGVESFQVENPRKGDMVKIYVTLGAVDNLQDTYRQISERSQVTFGKKPYELRIVDHRSPELTEIYYRLHYYMQEAIATGNFSTMASQVNAVAAERGVNARVYVDGKHIYVQLSKDGATLYEIIPREPEIKEKG